MRGYLPDCRLAAPATLEEALALLAREPGAWTPLAGGTDLMVLFNAGRLPAARLLDLSALGGLRGIQDHPDALSFGALTTFTELREAPAVHRHFPNLIRSARATGALAIQNRGTLGGNIANASPAADTPPSLLAYGAELELASVRGTRRIPYADFHLGYKRLDLAADELLVRIRVPKPQTGRTFHFFRKVGTRQAQAIAKLCLAAYGRVEDGVLAEFRLGLGSLAPVPARARRVEALLAGARPGALPVAAAQEALAADISPIDDIRASAHYRSVVARNVLGQLLRELDTIFT
jgi:CO/xanthine dehydrogenase FAD-binding subunit